MSNTGSYGLNSPKFRNGAWDALDPSHYLSGGAESEIGNTLGDMGVKVASSGLQNGNLIAAGVGAGLKVGGSVINSLIGIKTNEKLLNSVNNGINYANSYQFNTDNLDDIVSPAAIVRNTRDVYRGGYYSLFKSGELTQALEDRVKEASHRLTWGVKNNADRLAYDQLHNRLKGWYAFGGPLDFGIMPIGGAIDYELAQRRLAQKDLELKKALGGSLHTHGADWTNGVILINNGGTHENNPFEGVPMGLAPDGKPNLVEEGEVIFNDYVFSNRIKVPKAVREKYKLRGQKEMTFADAAKKAQKESEERPNDPISKRGLNDIMGKLMFEQEAIREQRQNRQYAKGGNIHIDPSKRGTFTAAASKHNMGVQEFASKVLANPEDYSPAMRKKANFARNASKWRHAYGGYLGRILEGPGDQPNYLWKWGPKDKTYYEEMQETPAPWLPTQVIIPKSEVTVPYRDPNDTSSSSSNPKKNRLKLSLSALRYAPALGTGILALTDAFGLTNKPDYTGVNSILKAARESEGNIKDVTFNPIGNYLAYKPFDTMFYGNQLAAQAAATRGAILNSSNGNRVTAIAGLLGADYNAQTRLGNLYRQGEEYNLAQRERVENFNRATNEFNSEGLLKAAMVNAENAQQGVKIRANAASTAAALRDSIDARVGAAKAANLTNLFDNLGNIGREAYIMDMIKKNPALLYDWFGRYKG